MRMASGMEMGRKIRRCGSPKIVEARRGEKLFEQQFKMSIKNQLKRNHFSSLILSPIFVGVSSTFMGVAHLLLPPLLHLILESASV